MAGRPIELQPVSTLVASLPDRNRRNSWKFQPFLLDDQTFHSFSTYNKKLAAIVVNSFSSVSVRKYKLSIYLLADFNAFLRLKLPGDVLVHDANICYGAKFGNQNSRRQWRSVVLKPSQKSLVFSFFFLFRLAFLCLFLIPHTGLFLNWSAVFKNSDMRLVDWRLSSSSTYQTWFWSWNLECLVS